MWFKNVQLFKLTSPIEFNPTALATELEPMAFKPCLDTLPISSGWISPVDDEHAPLVHAANGYMMICLQTEEKILPTAVINQKLQEKVKLIETEHERKVYSEEKNSLKDSIYNALLPQAFTKKSKLYAYFDTHNNWLILDTATTNKTELFLASLKRTLQKTSIVTPELKKMAPIMTHWLQNGSQPNALDIGKKCILTDLNQQSRVIRCQQQDLTFNGIQALLRDGYDVKQIELNWQDQVVFNLDSDFVLRTLKFQDKLIELVDESTEDRKVDSFGADFIIMTETLGALLKQLQAVFIT